MTDTRSYLQSIMHIRNKDNDELLQPKTIDIQPHIAKYSNTKDPIYKMILNNTPISRNNNLVVGYKCLTCSTAQEISLNVFIRKVNRSSDRCPVCVNNEKVNGQCEHSEKVNWDDEDDTFKKEYFLSHLTVEEFERIRVRIRGINHKKLTDLSDWTYLPYYRIWNQTRYTPMLLNYKTQSIEKPQYIHFICENCDNEFIHRDLEIIKNKIKIFCNDCTLCNKSFRIRSMNVDGAKILWQSVPERRFIQWCIENKIKIKNGPKIEYIIDNKSHIYKVDFELPELKLLIEIKDNHHWYKKHIANGVQEAKEVCALEWCKLNGYEYYIVFPKTLATIKERIIHTSCKI